MSRSASRRIGPPPEPPALRFAFELLRDVLGLVGAVLSAFAFFRLERRKTEAASADPETADDPDLKAEISAARGKLLTLRVLAPNEGDTRLTVVGLFLIALSFLISIALTFGEPSPRDADAPPAGAGAAASANQGR